MTKKKIIITVIIFLVLVGGGLTTFFIIKNNNKDEEKTPVKPKNNQTITITFDADGGTKVEPMKVKKGEKFELPKTEKKGYFFQGWFDGDVYYSDEDTDKLEKDTTLKALWANPDTPEDDVELKVTFDSNGGSKVKDMTFKCSDGIAVLKGLPKSKKDSYEFLSWEDKNGKSILDGAKIICDGDSLKLYAVWEYDGPVANPEQKPEDSKSYKCPDGYDLKDTNKCVSIKSPENYCPEGYKESNGTGSKVCYAWAGSPTSTSCKNGGVFLQRKNDTDLCGYEEVTRLTGNQNGCTNEVHGTMVNNRCFKSIQLAVDAILNHTCPGTSAYKTSAELGNTADSGCYKLTQRDYGCKKAGEGYSMNYTIGKCVRTIDATLE